MRLRPLLLAGLLVLGACGDEEVRSTPELQQSQRESVFYTVLADEWALLSDEDKALMCELPVELSTEQLNEKWEYLPEDDQAIVKLFFRDQCFTQVDNF